MIKKSRNLCVNLWDEGAARVENNPDVYIIFAEFVDEGSRVVNEVVVIATDTINEWMVMRHMNQLTMDDLKGQLEQDLSTYLEGVISIMVKSA